MIEPSQSPRQLTLGTEGAVTYLTVNRRGNQLMPAGCAFVKIKYGDTRRSRAMLQ